MAEPAKKQATYDDLYHIPENMVGEIIDGELIVRPRPTYGHARASTSLVADLAPPYDFGRGGPGGWIILFEPEIHFGANVVVPDLAGWKRERVTIPPSEHRITVAPDWVCEVLSPGTARIDRTRKMRIFADHKVPYVWLIDPALMTLEAYRLESGKWTVLGVYSENDKVRIEPFAAVEIDLSNLWLQQTPGDPSITET
jgi:Uma2 family endonuclease